MPEHWTELSAARKQRQLCSEEIRALRSSCDQACGKKPVTECHSCYGKSLDRMRLRYTESQDREWFTQRKAFLHELEGLFHDAKDDKRSLDFIESRIESEKEAWYRWVLRKYPEFIAVSDHGANQDELRGMLDDPDRSRQELVTMMLEGIGTPADWPSSVDALADKAAAIKGDAAELKKLYTAQFFMNRTSDQVLQNANKYLEEYKASESVTLEDIIDRIAADMKESRNSQPQRDYHQRRLDELRRAKTAFEHDKAQAKSRASGNQASTASEKLGNLPPCHVCQRTVDPSAVLSCCLCQVVTQMGGSDKLTVYCTEECLLKGHEEHVAAAHDCAAGDECTQLRDEDVEMEDGTSQTVSCKECLDQRRITLFCSSRCARENVAEHRKNSHGVKTSTEESDEAVTSMQQVVEATLARENPGIAMTRVE
ncbi:uncharacterized protein HRG_04713 [Hirsutella rhossiliensis]|uniref:Suppressor of anucleate metulae protein B n=1 Tax=Hirsutella rhossiliensis TaxID=111463 RepID=A0A9P8MZS5_9HYPO|nr:uncharacterized protein HRG_04713 [Hirsutella rhossiliensis]KAH0964285.1 hypothetical protein HRG_04713 [Hirsutella rhossiliensis]